MNTTSERLLPYVAALIVALTALAVGVLLNQPQTAVGSVAQTNEYFATTTGAFHAQSEVSLIKSGQGALGQVTVTGVNSGSISLYNATTSDITKRGNTATSSILLAELNTSVAAGTYTFDAVFTNGLLLVVSTNRPTSTITWR